MLNPLAAQVIVPSVIANLGKESSESLRHRPVVVPKVSYLDIWNELKRVGRKPDELHSILHKSSAHPSMLRFGFLNRFPRRHEESFEAEIDGSMKKQPGKNLSECQQRQVN